MGMFKTVKPPAPLDVAATTASSNTQNEKNAAANVELNRLDQTDANGNTLKFDDKGGVTQQLGGMGREFQTGLAGMGRDYMATAGEGAPDSSGAIDKAYEFATGNLEPRFARAQDAKYNQLRNQGLDPTSEAFKSATADLNLSQNEARNSLVTQIQQQMFGQGLQGRQQQLAELAPGMSYGTGSTQGNFANYNQVQQDNTNVGQLAQVNYGGQMSEYQQKIQQQNAMYGALASMAGTATQQLMKPGMPLGPGATGAPTSGWGATVMPK